MIAGINIQQKSHPKGWLFCVLGDFSILQEAHIGFGATYMRRVPQVSILRPGKPPMFWNVAYSIASNPFRRITFSNASAGPLGCLVPRSNCEM